jgi:hypothetical protein
MVYGLSSSLEALLFLHVELNYRDQFHDGQLIWFGRTSPLKNQGSYVEGKNFWVEKMPDPQSFHPSGTKYGSIDL